MAWLVAFIETGCKAIPINEYIKLMNILVFGKDGKLGKAFNALLDPQLSGLVNKLNIYSVGRSECDLENEQAITGLLSKIEPDLIINTSAYTSVDKAEIESVLAFAVNARAPELMAQYATEHDATFLHFSTDYVFDGEKYGFYLESDVRNPLSAYGKSKTAGEDAIARAFIANAAGQYAILRTSWVYGNGANFIRTILRLAKDQENLQVIKDQYGAPTSAQWLAQVSLDLVMGEEGALRKFPSGIYHAVPAGETSWYGLALLAVETALEAGASLRATPSSIKPIPAEEYPLAAPRPLNSRMSTDKLGQVFKIRGDMSKLKQLNQPWDVAVRSYVCNLAKDGII